MRNYKETETVKDLLKITDPIVSSYEFTNLLGLALRKNKKRAHLLVSKILGKHYPQHPSVIQDSVTKLVNKVLDHYPNLNDRPIVVFGYAETATNLGALVALGLEADYYIHSTRYPQEGLTNYGFFEEKHSHSTTHHITPEDVSVLNNPDAVIVLVDDELTTGKTILNTINMLEGQQHHNAYMVVTLTDTREQEFREQFIVNNEPVPVFSLLDVQLNITPDKNTVDFVSPRPDIVFLKRRLKPGESLPPTNTTTVSLMLNSSNEKNSENSLLTPDYFTQGKRFVLSQETPVVRLNKLVTGIGTLTITGAKKVAWETVTNNQLTNFGTLLNPAMLTTTETVTEEQIKTWKGDPVVLTTTGTVLNNPDNNCYTIGVQGEEPSPTAPSYGNRKLLEFVDGTLYVGLRHINHLRRMIIFATNSLTVNLWGGRQIFINLGDKQGRQKALYVSMINHELEFRRDILPKKQEV